MNLKNTADHSRERASSRAICQHESEGHSAGSAAAENRGSPLSDSRGDDAGFLILHPVGSMLPRSDRKPKTCDRAGAGCFQVGMLDRQQGRDRQSPQHRIHGGLPYDFSPPLPIKNFPAPPAIPIISAMGPAPPPPGSTLGFPFGGLGVLISRPESKPT